jgi:hypothetical protein
MSNCGIYVGQMKLVPSAELQKKKGTYAYQTRIQTLLGLIFLHLCGLKNANINAFAFPLSLS